jgi:hypothetical protein
MKTFFTRLIIFFSIILFILAFSLIISNKITKGIIEKNMEISLLVLGDSHSQNGINFENKLDSTLNLSNSAESYYFSEQKLQYFITNNIRLKKVLLAVGPHSFTKSIDSLWLFDKLNFIEKSRTYWSLMDIKSMPEFINKVNFSFFTFFELVPELFYQSFYTIERSLVLNKPPFIGGFTENTNSIKIVKKDKISHTEVSNKDSSLSEIQLFYLNKIIRECNENKIELILVNTPLFEGGKIEYLSKLNGTYEIIDYGDLFKRNSSLFADYVHLNGKGAEIFSDTLAKRLKSK